MNPLHTGAMMNMFGFFMPYLLPEVVTGISFSGMFNIKASSKRLNGSLDSESHISLFPKTLQHTSYTRNGCLSYS